MKKFYLSAILTLTSLNLFCQVNWEKHEGNPVMTANAESWEDPRLLPGPVIFYEEVYHMWYSGGDFSANGGFFRIGHATSNDGITWTRDLLPVLDTGSLGEWDDKIVWKPSVLLKDGVFHMWYSGYGNKDGGYGEDEIGYATSTDGITWIKDENNPVFKEGAEGEWDDPNVVAPSVIYDGTEYHMYYHTSRTSSDGSIGHATSPDGRVWARDPQNPVISKGTWDTPQTIYGSALYHNNTYHIWYCGGSFLAWDIAYATSDNGSAWTKYDNGPVFEKASEGFGSKFISAPSVIYDSDANIYKMWYAGQSTDGSNGIGYATAGTLTVGVKKNNSVKEFNIYPNPASEQITIKTNITGSYAIDIISINGQTVLSKQLSKNILLVDISTLPEGVYFITIKSDVLVRTEKVMKL